jgi:hypothetical protein
VGKEVKIMSEARMARQMGRALDMGSRSLGVNAETVNVGGIVIRTVSLIDSHPATAKLASRLNGDTGRAMRLFYTKAREHQETGSVTQAQIIRHGESSRPAVIGVQSGDSNPGRRVRAFFSRELGDVYALRAICKADEDGKVLDALWNMGYNQAQRTGRS